MFFNIGGFQKTSFLDYPEKISCIVFTIGCNFRCGYCHNPELFKIEPVLTVPAFFDFLNARKGKLDGVVITGGEPTLQSELLEFVKEIKDLNFLVKLDTNGTNPKILESLFKLNLLDYVAMDIKAPLDKYKQITNVDLDIQKIEDSINLIKSSNIDYEFRTTVLKSQLKYEDFEKIGILLQGVKKYYLQKFVVSKLLDDSLKNEETYSDYEFEIISGILRNYVDIVQVR